MNKIACCMRHVNHLRNSMNWEYLMLTGVKNSKHSHRRRIRGTGGCPPPISDWGAVRSQFWTDTGTFPFTNHVIDRIIFEPTGSDKFPPSPNLKNVPAPMAPVHHNLHMLNTNVWAPQPQFISLEPRTFSIQYVLNLMQQRASSALSDLEQPSQHFSIPQFGPIVLMSLSWTALQPRELPGVILMCPAKGVCPALRESEIAALFKCIPNHLGCLAHPNRLEPIWEWLCNTELNPILEILAGYRPRGLERFQSLGKGISPVR